MRFFFSAFGRAVRRFPRAHLALSTILVSALIIAALMPEPGHTIPESPQALPATTDALAQTKPSGGKPAAPGKSASAPTPSADKPQPAWTTLKVKTGDTLSGLLQAQGVTASQIHHLVHSDDRLKALADIRPGDTLRIALDETGALYALGYQPDIVTTVKAVLNDDHWQVQSHVRQYQRRLRFAEATINDSLFLASKKAGISDGITMQLTHIFAWDVDFIRDIRQGDHFQVLYEELYLDGRKVGEGHILAAEFWNRGRHLKAYRFRHENGNAEYMDAEGDAMRKAFIRTPVDFTRISSRFSMGRLHPILNRVRRHEGIDYAAPRGTPIKAAGKGKVIFAGVKSGYGNVIVLKHGRKYSTLYAHMHRFADGIHVGTRVEQGEVIGYVGMTGLATGPHLHYEFRVNGEHKNPLTVPLPRAKGVSDSERPRFLAHAEQLQTRMSLFANAATLATTHVF